MAFTYGRKYCCEPGSEERRPRGHYGGLGSHVHPPRDSPNCFDSYSMSTLMKPRQAPLDIPLSQRLSSSVSPPHLTLLASILARTGELASAWAIHPIVIGGSRGNEEKRWWRGFFLPPLKLPPPITVGSLGPILGDPPHCQLRGWGGERKWSGILYGGRHAPNGEKCL